MRADFPCPLCLLDCLGGLGNFGFAEEALNLALTVAFDSAGWIGSWRSQPKINSVVEQHMPPADRLVCSSPHRRPCNVQALYIGALNARHREPAKRGQDVLCQ